MHVSTTVNTSLSCAYAHPNACIANVKSSLNFLIGRLRSKIRSSKITTLAPNPTVTRFFELLYGPPVHHS